MTDKPIRVSGKVVIKDQDGRCLLLQRSMASKGNPGKWDLPGGKVDPGEKVRDAVVREAKEETGIDITLGRVVGVAESESPENRIKYLIFEGTPVSTDVELSEEHGAVKWVPRGELPNVDLVPQFKPFATKYASHERSAGGPAESKVHMAWQKDMPQDERRRNALRSQKGNSQDAARALGALASITTDEETKVKAKADAEYFYSLHEGHKSIHGRGSQETDGQVRQGKKPSRFHPHYGKLMTRSGRVIRVHHGTLLR